MNQRSRRTTGEYAAFVSWKARSEPGAGPSRICTSYIERHNLTMRMAIRRPTRLTTAFSRKLENLKAALALYFVSYNFCRIHGSLRITLGMAAGIPNRVWNIEELIE